MRCGCHLRLDSILSLFSCPVVWHPAQIGAPNLPLFLPPSWGFKLAIDVKSNGAHSRVTSAVVPRPLSVCMFYALVALLGIVALLCLLVDSLPDLSCRRLPVGPHCPGTCGLNLEASRLTPLPWRHSLLTYFPTRSAKVSGGGFPAGSPGSRLPRAASQPTPLERTGQRVCRQRGRDVAHCLRTPGFLRLISPPVHAYLQVSCVTFSCPRPSSHHETCEQAR